MTPEDKALRKDAYREVRHALADGRLVRPEKCAHCGGPKPQAHHHNGYEAAHQIDVMWLCGTCHGWLHHAGKCPPPLPPPLVRWAMLVLMEWSGSRA